MNGFTLIILLIAGAAIFKACIPKQYKIKLSADPPQKNKFKSPPGTSRTISPGYRFKYPQDWALYIKAESLKTYKKNRL